MRRTAFKKTLISRTVLCGERLTRMAPVRSVPRERCIRGAQCSPPRTAISNRSDSTSAPSSEGRFSRLNATIPAGFGLE